MLVFVSDIHLNDSTITSSVNPGAFSIFSEDLQRIISRSSVQHVTVILLGDIIDMLRSSFWNTTTLRPWSDTAAVDGQGRDLETVTAGILDRITQDAPNRESLSHLDHLRERLTRMGIRLDIEYLIGNHDRLINRFPSSVRRITGLFGTPVLSGDRLPSSKLWPEHRAFARHGDLHDSMNCENEYESSIGDAIVIDLLNEFLITLRKDPDTQRYPEEFVREIEKLEYVRPLLDIPLFVNGVCRRYGGRKLSRRVREIWDARVDRFVDLPYLQQLDKPLKWDLVNTLKLALFLSRRISNGGIARLLSRRSVREIYSREETLAAYAVKEQQFAHDEADYIVYGHTHRSAMVPIGSRKRNGSLTQCHYFNTGTWRKLVTRASHSGTRDDFAQWDVMTWICIFKDEERMSSTGESRRFEMWTGSLG